MLKSKVEIINDVGLHARPAAIFVQTAGKFESDVWLEKDDKKVNAKSIMGLISLAISCGTVVTIITDGEDEEIAMKELVELIESGFGEYEY